MSTPAAFAISSKESLTAVMDELKSHEFAAIGSEVLTLVGAPRQVTEDPVAVQRELTDAGLSFLSGLIEPLRQCLDLVTGDADSLNARAEQWRTLAASLRATGPQINQTAEATRSTWTGAASQAFDTTMHEFSGTVTGAAGACDGVVMLLQTSAELMTGAQGLITDILAQVVEYMIVAEASAAASASATFGASQAMAQAAIVGETAEGVEKAIAIVDRVTELLQRIALALGEVSGVFAKVTELLARLTKHAVDGEGAATI
ncbi:Proteins of 100 residues with WXG [Frankineae bacterium MT45]|nr:Proteins of 100 residues with WXG [Frankineae bacterium MT45]